MTILLFKAKRVQLYPVMHTFRGEEHSRSHVKWWTWLKFIQVPKKCSFWFFSFNTFTIDFKICLYARCWKQNVPNQLEWSSIRLIWYILFSQSFEELAMVSQNVSCEQCDLSKRLVYRHILKSIVKELKEKTKKSTFFGTWLNFN